MRIAFLYALISFQSNDMSQQKVFIIDGLRSPFVKAGKEFKNIHPKILGSKNIKEFIYKMNFKGNEVEEVIFGNSFTLPDAPNIARVIALYGGLDKKTTGSVIHKNCASSMESFVIAVNKIQNRLCKSVIAGGVESMSYTPLFLTQNLSRQLSRIKLSKSWKQKLRFLLSIKKRDIQVLSPLLLGLKDPFTGYSMGETAEILAREFEITKEEQNEFAVNSHKKAWTAKEKLKEEIFPFYTTDQAIDEDKGVKASVSIKRLNKMSGYFDKKYGSVTIANSCPINDGSALLLLMSEEKMKEMGLKPLASIKSSASIGLEPERMGLGPVYASSLALKKSGLDLKDIGLIEINEAFSAQILACLKAFQSKSFANKKLNRSQALGEIDPDKLNVNGGAIAIGHPISASGARLILTLAKEMKRRQTQYGLASLCVGGGQGGAVILELAV